MPGGITFAGNNLQTANILTQQINHADIPEKDARLYAVAHANKSAIPFISYPSKKILVSGTIVGSSIANLDGLLDTFRGYFTGSEQALIIEYNSGSRQYTATAMGPKIDRPGGLLYAYFEIEFICTQPFGYDTSNTTALSASGRTSATYSDSYTFLGTAPYQLPITTITLTATPGTPSNFILWGNGGNGQAIYVNRTWANGDILVIDCLQKTVTVNGAVVDFSGGFPEFPPGSQTLSYTDGFSSRTFTISVVYAKAYM